MTTMIIRRCLSAVVLGAVLMGVTNCGGGKKKQEEIDRLTEDLARMEIELQSERDEVKKSRDQVREGLNQIGQLKREKRTIESDLSQAKREVERYAKREGKREAIAKEREERENTREPSRQEKSKIAKEAAEKHLGAVVKIEGDQSTGSGFLVADGGKTWVYMAASVMASNTKLEIKLEGGDTLKPSGVFEVAGDADLARLEVTDELENKLSMAEPSDIKSGVALLGVSDVGMLVEGRSYGTEDTVLQINTGFSDTLPGSPVFNGETGALLGLVVDAVDDKRELWVRERKLEPAARRAACRLDRKIEWTAIPIATFLEEAKAIADADRLTRLVETFAAAQPTAEGVNLEVPLDNGMTASKFLKQNKQVSAVTSLYALDKWLKEKGGRAAPTDLNRRTKSVYTQMGRTSGRHTATFSTEKFSPYHAKMAEQSLEWRLAAEKMLADQVKGLEQ